MSIYPVSSAASTASNASTTSSTSSSSTDYSTMFMKLLTTELKSQDPTQAMDPSTMVTQMVQINQLGQVNGIYSLLKEKYSSTSTSTGGK
ncbi:MAG: hypothetical protein CXZ00_14135 [Acidobacteria bacterium]|nr:MAG: hypothetical protein CXZ00_14135 [Acidobacteriota bacterium]